MDQMGRMVTLERKDIQDIKGTKVHPMDLKAIKEKQGIQVIKDIKVIRVLVYRESKELQVSKGIKVILVIKDFKENKVIKVIKVFRENKAMMERMGQMVTTARKVIKDTQGIKGLPEC